MPSNESDRAGRRERARHLDQTLAADRQGRDRLRRRADQPGPGGLDPDVSRRLPNTYPGGPAMTVSIHGDRIGARAVGRPRTGRMLSSRDSVAVARAAKQLVQSGVWRTLPGRDDRARILTAFKARLPFALGQVPIDALVALAKIPPAGGCHWCCALVQRLPDRPELERNEATVALLGQGCSRCRARWQVDDAVQAALADAAEEERQLDAAVAAAGGELAWYRAKPAAAPGWDGAPANLPVDLAAAGCPRCQQVHRPTVAASPAPTGMLWPAGSPQPPAVTAALRSLTPGGCAHDG